MTLGNSIRRHRESVGMTANYLAGKVGVHRNTVANWERGRSEPTASELCRIAFAVGCSIEDLLSGENAEPVITSKRFCPGA